jgi:hypothetical protein
MANGEWRIADGDYSLPAIRGSLHPNSRVREGSVQDRHVPGAGAAGATPTVVTTMIVRLLGFPGTR